MLREIGIGAAMASRPHILIIGAGLIGLSSADALMRGGARVTIIEAKAGPALGASYSNSAMIHPSQARPWIFEGDTEHAHAAFEATLELAKRSKIILQDRLSDMGLASAALGKAQGCFKIYPDLDAARIAQRTYKDDGITASLIMNSEDTLGQPALYFENDIWSNAYEYCLALEKDLRARGATFIYEAADLRLRQNEGAAVCALAGHVIQTDDIVICAGWQSPAILAQLGLLLTLKAVKGYAVNFPRPDMKLPFAPIMDAQSHSAMTIFDDHLRFSGTVDESSVKPLLRRWAEIAPEIFKALSPAQEMWSGFRPVSRIGRPYIGASSIKGLWVNTGHGHMGWTLSAGSGELIARMILEGQVDARYAYSG